MGLFQSLKRRRDRKRLERFFTCYAGRTLIVHQGLGIDWLEELLRSAGAAAHFRIDTRPLPGPETPVSWVATHFIASLNLPLPVLCDVGSETIQIRHLRSRTHLCHPAEIAFILDDMRRQKRRHVLLVNTHDSLITHRELPLDDNGFELDLS